MPTTVPTLTDTEAIDVAHQAIDAINQILGELRGEREHDPDAPGIIRDALEHLHAGDEPATGSEWARPAVTVLPALPDREPATIGAAAVVLDNDDRRLTVSADVRVSLGELFTVVTIEDDWAAEDETTRLELSSSIPLDPDQAERLGHALLAAAAAARGGAQVNTVIVESELRTVAVRANGTGVIITEVSAGDGDQLGAAWIYLDADQAGRLAAAIHAAAAPTAWDQPAVTLLPPLEQ